MRALVREYDPVRGQPAVPLRKSENFDRELVAGKGSGLARRPDVLLLTVDAVLTHLPTLRMFA